jgi:hypothetical protein
MSLLNNNCQKKKLFGFTDVWYSSKSIALYVQTLLIVLIVVLHQQSNNCAKYNMKTLSVANGYLYGVPCFVFCRFYHLGADQSSCLLHMFVVFMLMNLEVYVGVEPCHCQNEFFCVVVLGTTVPVVCQLPYLYTLWWDETSSSFTSCKPVSGMSSADCGLSFK